MPRLRERSALLTVLRVALAALATATTFCASAFVITPHTGAATSTTRRWEEAKIASRTGAAVATAFNASHRWGGRPMEARRGGTSSRDDCSDERCRSYFRSAPLVVALTLSVSVIGYPPYSLAIDTESMESGGADAVVVSNGLDNNDLNLRRPAFKIDIDGTSSTTAADTTQLLVADDVPADEELDKIKNELAALNAEIARIDKELASTGDSGDTSRTAPPSTPFMELSDKIENSLDETALAQGKSEDQASGDDTILEKSNEIDSKASIVEEEKQATPETPKVKPFDYQKAADEMFDDGSTTWFSAGVSKGKAPSSYNIPSEPDPVIEGLSFKLFDGRNSPPPQ